jgi:hypothetical protein
MKAPVARLRLGSTLESEAGLDTREFGLVTRSLGLHVGLVRILLLHRQSRPRSSFSASAADSFSIRLRLLFSVADLSRTASVCCVRRRSVLPSSRRLSAANSVVRAPDAMCSAKAAAWHKNCQIRSHNIRAICRSQGLLTCFSCCATKPAMSIAAAAEAISPLAQNLDHGSCEYPFAPIATATDTNSIDAGTTASCPASDPAPQSC